MDAALEALKSQNPPNYAATAREFEVDRTSLMRRFKGQTLSREEFHETRQLLSSQQEKVLINNINILSERCFPPSNTLIRSMALEISKKQPGKNWASEFVKRHQEELVSTWLKGFDLSRKKADSWWSYKKYFEMVSILIIVITLAYINFLLA